MAKVAEQVGHAEMVGGAQTSLHSHSGGGGADVKSGHESGISCGATRGVTFIAPFSLTPNVVAVEDDVAGKEHSIKVGTVSVSGFTITVTKDHTGGACSTVGVYWIATDAGNS